MSAATAPALDLSTERGRAAFDCLRRELDESDAPLGDASASELFELGALFDVAAARVKRELLATSFGPSDGDWRLMAWIGLQHRELHQMGFAIAMALRAQASPLLPAAIAASLHHRGQAAKWCLGAAALEDAAAHEMMSVASVRKREKEPIVCKVDGVGRRTCVESLYFRALLLERFASGGLSRPHLEVLDAWLWEWSPALRGTRSVPAAPFLRVDLDSEAGLREGVRAGDGPCLYLPLAPLLDARRAVLAGLQRGRVVTTSLLAAEMSIEDHLAVADHLEAALRAPGAATGRAARKTVRSQRVEVWLGLNEILARGIGVGVETGRFARLSEERARAPSPMEAMRRHFWLHDESETGAGFEALADAARGVALGDLVAWRRFPGAPVSLGEVVRRLPRPGGEFFFGVRKVSDLAQPLKLVDCADRLAVAHDRLFIPGADPTGREDCFLLADDQFTTRDVYATHIGEAQYALRLNRVRHRGRGWLLAGFELVPDAEPVPGAAMAAAAAGELSLAPDPSPSADEANDDPWANEVRRKLG